jgi:cytochrome c-type biogenesis protein CcmH/NrfF
MTALLWVSILLLLVLNVGILVSVARFEVETNKQLGRRANRDLSIPK